MYTHPPDCWGRGSGSLVFVRCSDPPPNPDQDQIVCVLERIQPHAHWLRQAGRADEVAFCRWKKKGWQWSVSGDHRLASGWMNVRERVQQGLSPPLCRPAGAHDERGDSGLRLPRVVRRRARLLLIMCEGMGGRDEPRLVGEVDGQTRRVSTNCSGSQTCFWKL